MLSSKKVSERVNAILDEIIKESVQRCKVGKALRANYQKEELEEYIKGVRELKDSFNDHFWMPKG